jgi:hypothetical protein
VGQTVAKDEVSKVFVIRQDDALFTMSDREEFAVGQRMGIVDATSDDILALIGEEHCQRKGSPSSSRNLTGRVVPRSADRRSRRQRRQ